MGAPEGPAADAGPSFVPRVRALVVDDEPALGPGWFSEERVVDIHLGHVRHKLGDDVEAACCVRTVRGVGYRMGSG
jgi:hypothetical protein